MITNLILKRNASLKKIVLGSILGSTSVLLLFMKLNSIELFLIKILISIIMILIAFGYKDKKFFFTNTLYLYFVSMILGGFLYFLNIQFSYKNIGLIFIHKNISINAIFLIIISPLILYIYFKQVKITNKNINSYHKVIIKYKNKIYNLRGYLDTGNKLYEPYKKRCVSILYNKDIIIKKPFYIPYKTIDKTGVINCIIADELIIDNKKYFNQVIGVSNQKFIMDGIDIILHSDFKE